jgi:hypothetical protein
MSPRTNISTYNITNITTSTTNSRACNQSKTKIATNALFIGTITTRALICIKDTITTSHMIRLNEFLLSFIRNNMVKTSLMVLIDFYKNLLVKYLDTYNFNNLFQILIKSSFIYIVI